MWLRPVSVSVLLATIGVMHSMLAGAAELTDPTRPWFFGKDVIESSATKDAGAEEGAKTWVLSSTFVSETHRFAMVNEKLVRKGDKIGNMRVIDIKPLKVTLRNEDTSVEVTLLQDSIKTKVAKQTTMLIKDKVIK